MNNGLQALLLRLQTQAVRRPVLMNDDGSFSTEETTTVPFNNQWFNIPTIVNGARANEDQAYDLFLRGQNMPRYSTNSLENAIGAARFRSNRLGELMRSGINPWSVRSEGIGGDPLSYSYGKR